jgi:hypothetical protein
MTPKHSVLSESFDNTIEAIRSISSQYKQQLEDMAKVAGIRNGLNKAVTFDSVEREIDTVLNNVNNRMDQIVDLAKKQAAEINSPEFREKLVMDGLLKYATISRHQTQQDFEGKGYDREQLGANLTQLKNLNQAFEGVGSSIMKDFGVMSDPAMVVEKTASRAFLDEINKRHGVPEGHATYVPSQEPSKDKSLGI